MYLKTCIPIYIEWKSKVYYHQYIKNPQLRTSAFCPLYLLSADFLHKIHTQFTCYNIRTSRFVEFAELCVCETVSEMVLNNTDILPSPTFDDTVPNVVVVGQIVWAWVEGPKIYVPLLRGGVDVL